MSASDVPDRGSGRRKIGHGQQNISQCLLDYLQLFVERLDPLRHLPHFRDAVFGLALVLDPADFVGNPVAQCLQFLARLEQRPALFVQRLELAQANGGTPRFQACFG